MSQLFNFNITINDLFFLLISTKPTLSSSSKVFVKLSIISSVYWSILKIANSNNPLKILKRIAISKGVFTKGVPVKNTIFVFFEFNK